MACSETRPSYQEALHEEVVPDVERLEQRLRCLLECENIVLHGISVPADEFDIFKDTLLHQVYCELRMLNMKEEGLQRKVSALRQKLLESDARSAAAVTLFDLHRARKMPRDTLHEIQQRLLHVNAQHQAYTAAQLTTVDGDAVRTRTIEAFFCLSVAETYQVAAINGYIALLRGTMPWSSPWAASKFWQGAEPSTLSRAGVEQRLDFIEIRQASARHELERAERLLELLPLTGADLLIGEAAYIRTMQLAQEVGCRPLMRLVLRRSVSVSWPRSSLKGISQHSARARHALTCFIRQHQGEWQGDLEVTLMSLSSALCDIALGDLPATAWLRAVRSLCCEVYRLNGDEQWFMLLPWSANSVAEVLGRLMKMTTSHAM